MNAKPSYVTPPGRMLFIFVLDLCYKDSVQWTRDDFGLGMTLDGTSQLRGNKGGTLKIRGNKAKGNLIF